jgi:hypothetical protein
MVQPVKMVTRGQTCRTEVFKLERIKKGQDHEHNLLYAPLPSTTEIKSKMVKISEENSNTVNCRLSYLNKSTAAINKHFFIFI